MATLLSLITDLASAVGADIKTLTTGKAPLASPSFTGTPTAPTQASGNNTTRLATTAFVAAAISGLSGGGGSTNPTITYTGSAWPARTSVTVPSGGYAIYDSTGYPGATQPTDMVDGDVWNMAGLLMPALAGKSVSWFQATASNTSLTGLGVGLVAVGTATSIAPSGTTAQGRRKRVLFRVTTASTSAVAGFREAGLGWAPQNGFRFSAVVGPDTGSASNSTSRFFIGLTSVSAAATDVDPSTIANCLGLGSDSTDTTLKVMYRTGSGTVVKVDTGFTTNWTDSTEMYRLDMTVLPGGTTCTFNVTRLSDGAVFTHTSTTAIPAQTTYLSPRGMRSVGGTSSVVGFALESYYCESDI